MVVFLSALGLALATSLTYVYTRPTEYRAVARLKITPAASVTQAGDAKSTPTVTTDARSFLTEIQVLTSRPLLDSVFDHLRGGGPIPDLGRDPLLEAQNMLRAEPVAGTEVVELSAVDNDQAFAARLVNAVTEAYQQHVADLYKGSTSNAYGEARDELAKLDQQVKSQRQSIDAFGAQYDIVSMEHKENDVLAEIEGLSKSYTDAKNRRAKAQAHSQALQTSAAAGKAVVRAKDDPILGDMEQRTSVLREQWQDLQRRFTPAYLALDPGAKSLQARLESLESQLKAQREASTRAALAEAQEELAAANSAAERLRQDVADNQRQAQDFATHLNEYKALRQDLDHLEEMHRTALDRLTKLQASEQERAPRVEVLEAATPSSAPWRPDYQRDALIAVAGSLVFGVFAVWLADFIAGPSTSSALPTIMVQHSWIPSMLGREAFVESRSLAAPSAGELPAPAMLPRHLEDSEIVTLIGGATDEAQLAVLGLLMGLTADEVATLRWDQVDLSMGTINLANGDGRTIRLEEPLLGLLKARRTPNVKAAARTVLSKANGDHLNIEDIQQLIKFSAHDAGLDHPQEVTTDALRYTWLSFLLRQGIRAADVSSVAGHIPQRDLVAYIEVNSPKTKQPLDRIDRVLPVLRRLAGNGVD